MRVSIPKGTTKEFNKHKEFDKIFLKHKFSNSFYELKKDYSYSVQVSGEFGGDIKWNDCALELSWSIPKNQFNVPKSWDRDGILAKVQLVRFTGNCGVKALSHLTINPELIKNTTEILEFIESFAYHRLNCGILIGSDTTEGSTYSMIKNTGNTIYFQTQLGIRIILGLKLIKY